MDHLTFGNDYNEMMVMRGVCIFIRCRPHAHIE